MIRYIRETRTDEVVNECLVVDDTTGQYFIVSTLTTRRQNNTRVYRTDAHASTPNYWQAVGTPRIGGNNVHRCQAIRQLERFLANG